MCRNSLSSLRKPSCKFVFLPTEVALPRENSWRNSYSQGQQHLEYPIASPRPQFHTKKNLACGKILGKVKSPLIFRLNSRKFLPELPKIPRVGSHPWDSAGATSPFPSFSLFLSSFLDSRTKEFLPAEIPPIPSCCFSRDRRQSRITMDGHHPSSQNLPSSQKLGKKKEKKSLKNDVFRISHLKEPRSPPSIFMEGVFLWFPIVNP